MRSISAALNFMDMQHEDTWVFIPRDDRNDTKF